MTALVLLLGTIGAWLLFAGPLYQVALEMRGHDDASERDALSVEDFESLLGFIHKATGALSVRAVRWPCA